jgi:hypothetical protein
MFYLFIYQLKNILVVSTLTIMKNTVMNIHIQIYIWKCFLLGESGKYMSGIPELYGKFMYNFFFFSNGTED